MRECSYLRASREALSDALANDPRTFLIGQDIATFGGEFQTAVGLRDRFGPLRVRDLLSGEKSLMAFVVGAALTGARPIVDLMFADHLLYCLGDFVHQVGVIPELSQGRVTLPVVVRAAVGIGMSAGPFQSGNYHAAFGQIPGLRIVAPSSPEDVKGLLSAAIACDEPVLLLEDRTLLGARGRVPEEPYQLPLDRAVTVRAGTSLTIATYGAMVGRVLEAAELLDSVEVSAEVIDLRTLVPLDRETMIESVAKTGRLLLVDNGGGPISVMSQVASEVVAHALDYLDAPISRMTAPGRLVPYSPALEGANLPSASRIFAEAQRLMGA